MIKEGVCGKVCQNKQRNGERDCEARVRGRFLASVMNKGVMERNEHEFKVQACQR